MKKEKERERGGMGKETQRKRGKSKRMIETESKQIDKLQIESKA